MPLEWFERDGTERMAPVFELQSGTGKKIRLWDYKQRKPLVIYVLNRPEPSFLQQLQSELPAYEAARAQLLVIAALEPEQTGQQTANLNLTYPLLADPNQTVYNRYIQVIYPQYQPEQVRQKPSALFVADRYGSIWCYASATSPEKLPEQAEVLDALEFLGNLCNP